MPTAKGVALFEDLCNDAVTQSVFDAAVRLRDHVRESGSWKSEGLEYGSVELDLGQTIHDHPALAPPVIDMWTRRRPSNLPDPTAGGVLDGYRPAHRGAADNQYSHYVFKEIGTERSVTVDDLEHKSQRVELFGRGHDDDDDDGGDDDDDESVDTNKLGLNIMDGYQFKAIFPITLMADSTNTEPIAALVEAGATWLVHLQPRPNNGMRRLQIVSRLTEDGVEIHTARHNAKNFDAARLDRDFGFDTEYTPEPLPDLEEFARHVKNWNGRTVLPMTKFNALRRALLLERVVRPWMAALREAVEIKRMNPEGPYAPEHTVKRLVAAAVEAVKGQLALGLEAAPAKRQRV